MEDLDVKKLKPLARLGYMDYSVIDNIFEMNRPVTNRHRLIYMVYT